MSFPSDPGVDMQEVYIGCGQPVAEFFVIARKPYAETMTRSAG
jgi:hypothetical protein